MKNPECSACGITLDEDGNCWWCDDLVNENSESQPDQMPDLLRSSQADDSCPDEPPAQPPTEHTQGRNIMIKLPKLRKPHLRKPAFLHFPNVKKLPRPRNPFHGKRKLQFRFTIKFK